MPRLTDPLLDPPLVRRAAALESSMDDCKAVGVKAAAAEAQSTGQAARKQQKDEAPTLSQQCQAKDGPGAEAAADSKPSTAAVNGQAPITSPTALRRPGLDKSTPKNAANKSANH